PPSPTGPDRPRRTVKTSAKTLAVTGTLALGRTAGGDSGSADAAGVGELVGSGSGDYCVIAAPVPVGAVVSLTGAAASYGESQKKGLELALEQLTEKGGVEYDLKIEDDATDPRQGITVFEQLSEDRSALIGPTLSNGAFQAQPI